MMRRLPLLFLLSFICFSLFHSTFGFTASDIPTRTAAPIRRRACCCVYTKPPQQHQSDRATTTPTMANVTVLYGTHLQQIVPVAANETLLAAMERIPALRGAVPHDCRKGTCLTCAAVVVEGTIAPCDDDGLTNDLPAPYVLPCRTTAQAISNDDDSTRGRLVLRLEACQDVWNTVYRERLGHPPDRSTVARALRKHAERNVESWMVQTEQSLQDSSASKEEDENKGLE